jgi:ribose 5-phosphate isomerase B
MHKKNWKGETKLMLALASDHVGIELKNKVMEYFDEKGISYRDYGTCDTQRVNYPEYALKAAKAVVDESCEKGILFCGTGIGISIAANKVHGVRCVVCSEPYSALLSRQHNDTNMLALGSRVVGKDLALMIIESWLAGQYEGNRHAVRVEQISQIEQSGELENG